MPHKLLTHSGMTIIMISSLDLRPGLGEIHQYLLFDAALACGINLG